MTKRTVIIILSFWKRERVVIGAKKRPGERVPPSICGWPRARRPRDMRLITIILLYIYLYLTAATHHAFSPSFPLPRYDVNINNMLIDWAAVYVLY